MCLKGDTTQTFLGIGKVKVWLFANLWTVAFQAPLSLEFSRQKHWSGLPCPPPGDPLDPGIEHRSPALHTGSLPFEPPGKPKNSGVGNLSLLQGIFPTQESNPCLLLCRRILYCLSHQGTVGSPKDIASSLSFSQCWNIHNEAVDLNQKKKKKSYDSNVFIYILPPKISPNDHNICLEENTLVDSQLSYLFCLCHLETQGNFIIGQNFTPNTMLQRLY